MGSTSDYFLNFFTEENWIDLSVLNQITEVQQKYEQSITEAKRGRSKLIDFII